MISDHYDKSQPIYFLESTKEDDGHGSKNTTWSIVSGNQFFAKIRLLSAEEAKNDDRMKYQASHLMHCDSNVPVKNYRRIRKAGVDYEVGSVRDVRGHHLKVILAEVTA